MYKKKETYGLIKSEFELNPTTSQFARLTIHHISWNIQVWGGIKNDFYLNSKIAMNYILIVISGYSSTNIFL